MNRVFINPAHVIEIHVIGDQTAESVIAMCDKVIQLIEKLGSQSRPIYIIDNLKAMGETTPDARSAVAYYAKNLHFNRVAMVGDGSIMMRLGTNLMLRAIGKSNIRYFSSIDSALLWFGLEPSELHATI